MPPSEFYIQLQQGGARAGFAGGIAPPPSAGHAITRSAQSQSLQIQSASGGDQQSAEFTPSKAELVDEIQGILKDLPSVGGSSLDVIYDPDVGLFWGSDSVDLPAWKNKRQGEIGEGEREGSSWRQATDNENAKFKRAVELVGSRACVVFKFQWRMDESSTRVQLSHSRGLLEVELFHPPLAIFQLAVTAQSSLTTCTSGAMLAQDRLPRSQPWRSSSFNGNGQTIGSTYPEYFSPTGDIQSESRVTEAINARDVVVRRLANACLSLREKTTLIEQLEKEKLKLQHNSPSPNLAAMDEREDADKLVSLVRSLREEIKSLKLGRGEQPPNYEECQVTIEGSPNICTPTMTASDSLFKTADDPDERLGARHALLASLPLPNDIPSDSLRPITLPASFGIHEFLGAICHSQLIRNQLETYRVFDKLTTAWCPEKEEHGYFLAPAFKCITNPRTATAHNWNTVDNVATMTKPAECFYNRDGKWYYAGTYKAVKLEDLTAAEYSNLSSETTQALIRETISGRRGASPQNFYETGQLYSIGALKVSCVGLQCVAFNNDLYRAVLEHAAKFMQSAHGNVLGSGSSGWNTQASVSSLKAVGVNKDSIPVVFDRGSRRDRKENL